jgi:ankyrin repeat protein
VADVKRLFAAIEATDLAGFQTLVADGADINASHRGYTPLHALIQSKPHAHGAAPTAEALRMLRWMLAHGADPERLGGWPAVRAVILAAITGVPTVLDVLIDAGAKTDVYVAAATGDLAAVRRAIARDAAVATSRDASGLTVLQCAAASRLWQGDAARATRLIAVAEALLDAGADVRAITISRNQPVTAAYFAASAHHVALFDVLLARGADATEALTAALWNGGDAFAALAERALAHGAEVNRAEAAGRPLLNDLIRWGQFAPARWLLAHGADPNRAQREGLVDSDGRALDSGGWTALHQAAARGNAAMVADLLAAGADTGRRDAAGRTPLDIARVAPLKTLLKKARGIMHS